ncbi:hypothetical protein WME94_35110 [Sorangium sp. So ce429]
MLRAHVALRALVRPGMLLRLRGAYGGTGNASTHAIASDALGNFYITGSFDGTVDFGGGPLTSAGRRDIFLFKLDPSGALLWSKRFGSTHEEYGFGVNVDGSGNVLLAGGYQGDTFAPIVDFGGDPLPFTTIIAPKASL